MLGTILACEIAGRELQNGSELRHPEVLDLLESYLLENNVMEIFNLHEIVI